PKPTLFPYTTLFRSFASARDASFASGLLPNRLPPRQRAERIVPASAARMQPIVSSPAGVGSLTPNRASTFLKMASFRVGVTPTRSEEHTSELQSRSD